jgi:hypothetical protein
LVKKLEVKKLGKKAKNVIENEDLEQQMRKMSRVDGDLNFFKQENANSRFCAKRGLQKLFGGGNKPEFARKFFWFNEGQLSWRPEAGAKADEESFGNKWDKFWGDDAGGVSEDFGRIF